MLLHLFAILARHRYKFTECETLITLDGFFSSMQETVNGRILKTTFTTLEILDLICENGKPTTAKIADETGLSVSTVHGHLATLMHTGYIKKIGDRFVPGMKMLSLGKIVKERDERYRKIDPVVTNLSNEVGEGVNFLVEEYGKAIIVCSESSSVDDPNFQVGRQYYLHNTAGGKAILADCSDDFIKEIIEKEGLKKVTDATITSEKKLFDEISKIRESDVAFIDEEPAEAIRAVATTIHDADNNVFGALAIGGPKYRMSGSKFRNELPELLKSYASRIEDEIIR